MNEHRPILGYRIYIDDVFKGAIDPGRFEVIIDYIRDEGEYKIKLRTYDMNGESEDSNVVIARFRRQQPVPTPPTDLNENETINIHRTQSDHIMDNNSQIKTIHTPLRQTQSHDDLIILPTQPQTEIPTTPDKKTVNQNYSLIQFFLFLFFFRKIRTNVCHR